MTTPAAPIDPVPVTAVPTAGEAIVTVDAQQRIVMINPAAQRMFGCSAADALGSPLSRFIPAELREIHDRHVSAFARSGRPEARMGEPGFVTGRRASGELFQAEASISRVDFAGPVGPAALLHRAAARPEPGTGPAAADRRR